jgi:hypothetical protein
MLVGYVLVKDTEICYGMICTILVYHLEEESFVTSGLLLWQPRLKWKALITIIQYIIGAIFEVWIAFSVD